jgi:predicted outer membrane protein
MLIGAAVTAGALATGPIAVAHADGALPNGYAMTQWGPLGAADRDLMEKVRLAGLWEMPAGQMAAEKGQSARVRAVGAEIAKQHGQLDELVRAAASKLSVPLPDQPNSDQQGWLREMRQASGAQFDNVFIERLRTAHGKVFPAIAQVRSGTRNSVVRELAQRSNNFVMTHMVLLESSGLVDYNGLQTPPPPAQAGPGSVLLSSGSMGGVNPTVIWIVLGFAALAGAAATFRLLRPR